MRRHFRYLSLIAACLPGSLFGLGNNNPTGPTGEYNGLVSSGGSYDPHTGNATRVVDDIVVAGALGAYPLAWRRTLMTRDSGGLHQFGSTGHWRHSYAWQLNMPLWTPEYVSYPDGRKYEVGADNFGISDRFYASYPPPNYTMTEARLRLSDGGQVHFTPISFTNIYGQPDSRLMATEVIDPHGLVTVLAYDGNGLLYRVTEPGGRFLQINYITDPWEHLGGDPSQPSTKLISSVEAHSGTLAGNADSVTQAVSYSYAPFNGNPASGYTTLAAVDYSDGTRATYGYQSSNTYDPTSGQRYGLPLIARCDDVRYAGAMRKIMYEFKNTQYGEDYGGVYREKSGTTGEVVSQLNSPNAPSDGGGRDEIRGDGPQRHFQYNIQSGKIASFTDFRGNTTNVSYYTEWWLGTYEFSRYADDANGRRTVWGREPNIGAITDIWHAQGTSDEAHESFGYDDLANPYYLQTKTDARGQITTYRRDANHRVWRIEYPDTGSEEFAYNNFGQVTSHRMTNGATEYFDYDGRGMKWRWINAVGGITYYGYDVNDYLSFVSDPRGGWQDPNYTTRYWHNQRGQLTAVQYPPVAGEPAGGAMTRTDYDDYGNKVRVQDELGHQTWFSYDDYKRLISTTDALGTGPGDPAHTTSYGYTRWWTNSPYLLTAPFVFRQTSPMGKEVYYDCDDNLRRTLLRLAPNTVDDAFTFYGYDNVGNLISEQDPRNNVTTHGYDARHRRTSTTNALNQTGYVGYDAAGNKTWESRPDGTSRSWSYDALNRLQDSYGFAGEHTGYGHDLAGNVTAITDAKGAVYTFGYDPLNRKTSEAYPLDAYGGRTELFWYDPAGNLRDYKNPDDCYEHLDYDNRSRVSRTSWNVAAQPIATRYDAASRVTSIETPETGVYYGYDDANRQISEDQTLAGSPTHRVAHDLDADGNLINTQVPGWYGVIYDYNQRNQLWHIYTGDGSPWFNYSYDSASNMTQRVAVYGGVNDSVNAWSQFYDPLNRPTMWENTRSGGNPYARSWYQYDSVGREVATWRDEQSSQGERFGFAANDQLASVRYNADQVWTGNAINGTRAVDYAYTSDKLNRSSVNENGAVTGYASNAMNQYMSVGGQAYVYDGSFNLWQYNGAVFNFSAERRFLGASRPGGDMQCVNDGLGRCVKRTVNGAPTVYVYDGWKPILELDANNGFRAWNVYGPGQDEILWRYQSGVGHLRYHSDLHGNVTSLLDWSGNIIEKYTYDAFGKPKITGWWDDNDRGSSWYGNRFMYTGREWFSELGVYDYRNRIYDPQLGRFLQTDPKGFDAGDMNLFRYCADDPVDRTDPMGLIWESEGYTNVWSFDGIQGIRKDALGGTIQKFWIDGSVVQAGDKYVIRVSDTQIRSHSYVRTHNQPSGVGTKPYDRSERQMQRTRGHEERQQAIDKNYYDTHNSEIKNDVGKDAYRSKSKAEKALKTKEQQWRERFLDTRNKEGRQLQRSDTLPNESGPDVPLESLINKQRQ